jgi:hypothetical protein
MLNGEGRQRVGCFPEWFRAHFSSPLATVLMAYPTKAEARANPNVIAEVFVRKARWQMAVASFWHQGIPFSDIPNRIMDMGKFPSLIWHSEEMDGDEKRIKAEVLPMYFMASQTVDFVRDAIVGNKPVTPELKKKVLNRAVTIYLFIQEKLFTVRQGSNPDQDLAEMTRILMNTDLNAF